MSRIPTGTYRLQLHADFGFDAAAGIADYLKELGISHVYSSPYLQAAPGSKHGYDVVDHHRVNEELGGPEAHDRFCQQLGACGLGQVLDVVPNHMAIAGRRNRYWWDILENGPSSRYASYFDIDWQPHEEKLRGKLLVPILGDHYGRAINRREIQVQRRGGDFFIKYFDHELPAAPRSLPTILSEVATQCGSDYLAFLSDSLVQLPAATDTKHSHLTQRHRDKAVIGGLLERLFAEVPFIGDTVDKVIGEINKNPDRLDAFLEQQNYRLAHWRTSEQDLGYRRFFDVNTLVGLRMEDPKVFADTHALVLRWLRDGVLDGIRIDHPDGLRDPRQYFERLREEAPVVWILAEKILEPGESLRSEWPIDGTTGYDYLNEAAGVFIDRESEEAMTAFYAEFTGQPTDYDQVCREKKQKVLRDLLGSDVNRLATLLLDIFELHRDHRDYTRQDATRAIRELVAAFPVYRTYVIPARDEKTAEDEKYVNEAVETAKANRPDLDPEIFDFMADLLLLRVRGNLESEFVYRFQQFCGPAMAKGVEDTAFYCFNRLVSLNEVGGNPGVYGNSVETFHEMMKGRQERYPRGMLASSTHDTKRSEDVRARINLLSEIPDEWRKTVTEWSDMNEHLKTATCPDRNTEYLIYQTMIGAWPIGTDRLLPYLQKATREAKGQTNWLAPNEAFENATNQFVEGLYKSKDFMRSFEAFVDRLIEPGRANALSQALLKLTAPGVPDTYQGTELWDLSLVDPDNRRPVDYDLRRRLLKEIAILSPDEIAQRADEGLPKLWVTSKALHLRDQQPKTFGEEGPYKPLEASGAKANHVVAFQRGENVAVVVTRLPIRLGSDWNNTTLDLPKGRWKNVLNDSTLDGGKTQLAGVLRPFPVALLVKE